ncbi:MAG: hypothetical protein ACRCRZ_00775 [Metamycoplasmataceae bacterium]
MKNFLSKNKKNLIKMLFLLLIICFISFILILVVSTFFNGRIMTMIGLLLFCVTYVFINVNTLLIFIIKQEIKEKRKFNFIIGGVILAIPISLLIIGTALFFLKLIPDLYFPAFNLNYFYLYFLPIIVILWQIIYFIFFYKKEFRIN